MSFLTEAVEAGKLSDARMSTLIVHESILAQLRAVAEGRDSFHNAAVYVGTLEVRDRRCCVLSTLGMEPVL